MHETEAHELLVAERDRLAAELSLARGTLTEYVARADRDRAEAMNLIRSLEAECRHLRDRLAATTTQGV